MFHITLGLFNVPYVRPVIDRFPHIIVNQPIDNRIDIIIS